MDRQVVHEGRFLRFCKTGHWEYVERTRVSGAVAVLAITGEGRMLFVEQFRPPVGGRVIEVPAGLAGDVEGQEHEAFAEAARRELLEETGYEAEHFEFLMDGQSSAGLANEPISLYAARGLRKVGQGGGVHSEDILVHEVPVPEAEAWLARQRREGVACDFKVYTALYFALKETQGR
jgi:ADP-ribose pyrophosphatase